MGAARVRVLSPPRRSCSLPRRAADRAAASTTRAVAAVCEDAGLEVIEAAPDGGYAAVLGHVVGMDTRFFSDEEISGPRPHWKDPDNLHHKVVPRYEARRAEAPLELISLTTEVERVRLARWWLLLHARRM